ncbi:hypothetical protein BV25DRAFT_1899069 [Artomyces pyxidatus]|uniref:Uncharacterized protein n=1 Tax=Artomyces pyxidatus TaxID=48021 RepID=A0ACB8T5U6_9AGAM|nr:hypothetical protein BV25DRAFT_1899069 [Artomyces pyxidatus]
MRQMRMTGSRKVRRNKLERDSCTSSLPKMSIPPDLLADPRVRDALAGNPEIESLLRRLIEDGVVRDPRRVPGSDEVQTEDGIDDLRRKGIQDLQSGNSRRALQSLKQAAEHLVHGVVPVPSNALAGGVRSEKYLNMEHLRLMALMECCDEAAQCLVKMKNFEEALVWLEEVTVICKNTFIEQETAQFDWFDFNLQHQDYLRYRLAAMARASDIFLALGNTGAAVHRLWMAKSNMVSVPDFSPTLDKRPLEKLVPIGRVCERAALRHPEPKLTAQLTVSEPALQALVRELRVGSALRTAPLGRFYVCGGRKGARGPFYQDMQCIDLQTLDRWRPLPAPPGPVINWQMHVHDEGAKAYLFIGGRSLPFFDLLTETWGSIQTTWAGPDPTYWPFPENDLVEYSMVITGGRLYVFGGTHATCAVGCNYLMVLDLATRVWRKLSGEPGPLVADSMCPGPRRHAAMWVDGSKDRLWLLYGEADRAAAETKNEAHAAHCGFGQEDFWSWDIVGESCRRERIAGNPPCPRSEAACTFSPMLNKVILFGGYCPDLPTMYPTQNFEFSYYADTFIFSPGQRTWKHCAQAHLFSDPETGRVFLFGGYTNSDFVPNRKHPISRSFGDLWQLRTDVLGGFFQQVDLEEDARTAKAGPWQRCFTCGSAGPWKRCGVKLLEQINQLTWGATHRKTKAVYACPDLRFQPHGQEIPFACTKRQTWHHHNVLYVNLQAGLLLHLFPKLAHKVKLSLTSLTRFGGPHPRNVLDEESIEGQIQADVGCVEKVERKDSVIGFLETTIPFWGCGSVHLSLCSPAASLRDFNEPRLFATAGVWQIPPGTSVGDRRSRGGIDDRSWAVVYHPSYDACLDVPAHLIVSKQRHVGDDRPSDWDDVLRNVAGSWERVESSESRDTGVVGKWHLAIVYANAEAGEEAIVYGEELSASTTMQARIRQLIQTSDEQYEAKLPALQAFRRRRESLEEEISTRRSALEEEIDARRRAFDTENDAQRRALDHDILSTVFTLSTIRAGRNALAPAAMLPYDILQLIFEELALEQRPGLKVYREGRDARQAMLGWITVTHVCWHWRQAALAISRLWSQDLTPELGLMWFSLMLTRSRKMPISVILCSTTLNSREAEYLQMLIDHFPRIRSLTVYGDIGTISSWLLPKPMPQLQNLTLSVNHPRSSVSFYNLVTLTNLPPTLCRLSLSNFTFAWTSIPTGLTRLSVAWSQLPISKFMECIKSSSQLESLTLLHTTFRYPAHGEIPPLLIRLPALARLVLTACLDDIVWLLDHIEVQNWTQLHLQTACVLDDRGGPVLLALVPFLRRGGQEPISFRTLSIEHSIYQLRIAADSRSAVDTRGCPSFTFLEHKPRLLVMLAQDHADLHAQFLGVCATLPLHDLDALSLDFRESAQQIPIMGLHWVEKMVRCANVTHLRVYGVWASQIFNVLRYGDSELGLHGMDGTTLAASTQAPSPLLFPRLRSLVIRDIDGDALQDGLSDSDGDRMEPADEVAREVETPWTRRLFAALESRRTVAPRLQLLDIGRCTFDEYQLREFEEAVEEVVWDGDRGEADGRYKFERLPDVWEDCMGDDSDEESEGVDQADSTDSASSGSYGPDEDTEDVSWTSLPIRF